MNKNHELRLKNAAAALTRADNAKDLMGMANVHKAINRTVEAVYNNGIDVPTALRVEKIMNSGHANVLGKSQEAKQTSDMLARQAEAGIDLYRKFARDPKTYVEWAEDTRRDVQRGKPFRDNVPYDPVRSGLTELRDQLVKDLVHRSGDPFPDRERANRLRLDATIKAERDYLEHFIDNRKNNENLKETQKAKALETFDARVAKQLQKVEPEHAAPKRSQGMSL